MKNLYCLIICCLGYTFGHAQNVVNTVQAAKIADEIVLDGELNESAWQRSEPAKDFWTYFPTDSARAKYDTEVYFAYDEDNLYVAVKLYSPSQDYAISSLKRDFRAGGSDNFTLLFDTFGDGANCFMFGMNPAGVRREGLISGGGRSLDGFTTSWDNKWKGESKIHDGYWISEMAIPFKTLRYTEGAKNWRFNCYRFDMQSDERTSTWNRIPNNQWMFSLGFMGDLQFETPLPKPGANFSLIPYASGGVIRDFEAQTPNDWNGSVGGDAKIAITSGLNLDLTFNPDFSQVEVDRQQANLTRFELFFPERRQFFIENADLFGSFGFRLLNPFFSRRIGIGTNSDDETVQTPIRYGVRLSGKLDENWRVGLLNSHTAADMSTGVSAANYSVAAIQRKVFSQSNIGAIFVNRLLMGNDSDSTMAENQFNRVVGLDYNLASKDNAWSGKTFFHYSFNNVQGEEPFAHGLNLKYTKRAFALSYFHARVGEDYNAEAGFVRRSNYFVTSPRAELFFYPEAQAVNQYKISFRPQYFWEPNNRMTDNEFQLRGEVQFFNNMRLEMEVKRKYTYLFDDFDPAGTEDGFLPANTDYVYWDAEISYNSDRRKVFNYRIRPSYGQFFSGTRASLRGNFNYRFQPYGAFSIEYNLNRLDLPEYPEAVDLVLIGPRLDLTFTKKIFLTTFVQYNNQADNFNINARFQWRYAPVSDFFLVYTENYFANDFNKKNRAIVGKVTCWLNL